MNPTRETTQSSRSSRSLTLAERADRYALYQRSVQDVAWEMHFVEQTFRALRKRAPRQLREDFCGTALAACEWVKRNRRHQAIGVDIDPAVLAWGRQHNVSKLASRTARRLRLLQADVLTVQVPTVDIILAFNFSYWIFKERALLRKYFRQVRQGLSADGIFMLDAYGGYDAFREMREREDFGRFTYIWEQAAYEPVSGQTTCHIHFSFPDGSRLRQAFSYHWRLWTLPELRELLAEAGFEKTTVYFEGTDAKTGEGNGVFQPTVRGKADPAWIAYIMAQT